MYVCLYCMYVCVYMYVLYSVMQSIEVMQGCNKMLDWGIKGLAGCGKPVGHQTGILIRIFIEEDGEMNIISEPILWFPVHCSGKLCENGYL